MNNTLYIIGNGFDVHHGVQSRYANFEEWLRFHNPEVRDWLLQTCQVDFLWQDFERALAFINRGHFIEMGLALLPQSGFEDDNFSMAEFEMPADMMRGEAEEQWYKIKKAFRQWIQSVHLPDDYDSKKVHLDINAFFINFNYTRCLETHYGVDSKNILYIHGVTGEKKHPPLIGHDSIDDGFDFWYKNNRNRRYRKYYNKKDLGVLPEFEHVVEAAEEFRSLSEKPVDRIMFQNKIFFDSLKYIDEVIVCGHSLAKVDLPYFKNIQRVCANSGNLHWKVSFYFDNEIQKFTTALKSIGVDEEHMEFFRLNEITEKQN